MFSVKKNVLQTVALLKANNVRHIVISPGSRNAPLIQTFTSDSFFECHTIVDERNASFYGIGIIQCLKEPVAICCTSGSALLNYAPAVSEAYYQQLPLIVISADRSPEWIGQMDGQTIPQANIFGSLSKRSVNLPEIKTENDEWHCNRLLNEAFIICTKDTPGPVHINVPIGEPLFDYSESNLPEGRKINYKPPRKITDIDYYSQIWNKCSKRIIIVGQQFYNAGIEKTLEELSQQADCIVITEHISNCSSNLFISSFDAMLYAAPDDKKKELAPDLVIYFGGHITSKRLKHFIREVKPANQWNISNSGEIYDLFQSLTDQIECDPLDFFSDLSSNIKKEEDNPFQKLWSEISSLIKEPDKEIPFSDLSVTRDFAEILPANSILYLASSSSIRNIQLFSLPPSTTVYSNRGVNGIESTIPSVIGFAAVSDSPVYLLIGDLSFFYGLSAIWNTQEIKNLRILLINNSGGGIFHLLPGLNKSSSLEEYVTASHSTSAEQWVKAAGFAYISASNEDQLKESISLLNTNESDRSMVLEVFTDIHTSKKCFQEYYHNLKSIY